METRGEVPTRRLGPRLVRPEWREAREADEIDGLEQMTFGGHSWCHEGWLFGGEVELRCRGKATAIEHGGPCRVGGRPPGAHDNGRYMWCGSLVVVASVPPSVAVSVSCQ